MTTKSGDKRWREKKKKKKEEKKRGELENNHKLLLGIKIIHFQTLQQTPQK